MAIVVPRNVRLSLEHTYAGNSVFNIFDVSVVPSPLENRDACVADVAAEMVQGWGETIMPAVVNQLVFEAVHWVDQDSEDGSTGTAISGPNAVELPLPGSLTGDEMPGNVSALITKQIAGGGRRTRNGRTYLCGLQEADTGPNEQQNVLTTAAQTRLQTAATAFLNEMNDDHEDPDYVSRLGVVHVLTRDGNGNPLTGEHHNADAFIVDDLLATQRRRLRR